MSFSIGYQIQTIMKKENKNKKPLASPLEKNDFPDYPLYPSSDDVYSKFKEEDINLDLNVKEKAEKTGKSNENTRAITIHEVCNLLRNVLVRL